MLMIKHICLEIYSRIRKDAVISVRILKENGLNEVFVGELDSTKPSHLEIEINNSGEKQRIKCSGKFSDFYV